MSDRFKVLSAEEVQKALSGLSGWELRDGALAKDFKFKNFVEAFSFMTAVAMEAEKLDHHPVFHNVYNKVTIGGLCTHDAEGQITTLDVELARKVNEAEAR